jgi:hypothetical protein
MVMDKFKKALSSLGLANYVYTSVPISESDLANVTLKVVAEDGTVTDITDPSQFEFTWAEISSIMDDLPDTDGVDLRIERDKRLSKTDWTQMPDSPLDADKKAEFAVYRQALRDITKTYTSLDYVIFPEEPEA